MTTIAKKIKIKSYKQVLKTAIEKLRNGDAYFTQSLQGLVPPGERPVFHSLERSVALSGASGGLSGEIGELEERLGVQIVVGHLERGDRAVVLGAAALQALAAGNVGAGPSEEGGGGGACGGGVLVCDFEGDEGERVGVGGGSPRVGGQRGGAERVVRCVAAHRLDQLRRCGGGAGEEEEGYGERVRETSCHWLKCKYRNGNEFLSDEREGYILMI